MNLYNKKKYIKIKRETGSDETVALLDEVNSDLEDNFDNLMNDLDTEFVLEEGLENELDSDDETLNSLVPEAKYHIVENPTIGKSFEEVSCKAINDIEIRIKERGKERGKAKKKKSDLMKLNLIG